VAVCAWVGAASANPRVDAWQAKRPFTLTSSGQHEYGGARIFLDEFNGSGLNTAMDSRWFGSQTWPVPESYGLPLIYVAYTPSGMEHFLTHWNEARSKHRNIIAVFLGDEMAGRAPGELASIRACRDWIVDHADPAIAALLTIDSEACGDTVSADVGVQQAWDREVEAMRPDVWLAQFYPIGGGELKPSYYSSLEWYFRWAQKNDVAMWCWLDTWSSSSQGIPCESELRLQRFTSLAYGMRGFADFLWTADGNGPSVKGAGYWDGSGTPTRIYADLQTINREVAQVANSLIRLTPVRAYHMDGRDDGDGVHHWSDSDSDLPAWQRRSGRLANVTGATNGNHLLVGFFRDVAGAEYFMVVNKDFARETAGEALTTPVTLTFHPGVEAILRLSRQTGRVERIKVSSNHVFDLPGGTGDLFTFDTGAPFAGVGEVTLPALRETTPAQGRLCGLAGNRITLRFDGNAREVVPEIRWLDAEGHPQGRDLGEQFERTVFDGTVGADGLTLKLREKGAALPNGASFQVTLHYAEAEVQTWVKRAGDIDGDGQLAAADLAAFAEIAGAAGPARADLNGDGQLAAADLAAFAEIAGAAGPARADLNGDGIIGDADRVLLEKLVNAKPFQWTEAFDAYPVGPLAGNGQWLEAEGFPGSLLARSWLSRTALVAAAAGPDQAGRAVGGGTALTLDFIGNEARFKTDGGLGEFGLIRWEFTTHAGPEGFQNNAVHLFNSQDKAGECGLLAVEQENGQIVVAGSRGIIMERKKLPAPVGQGKPTDPFRVRVLIDCDRRLVTWSCTNLSTGAALGPFDVPFSGTFRGIDATSVVVAGAGAGLDDIVIGNQ
jgi:hypothetical protein